jgi:predicted molibdopterin-dependent oxidoreductase YjgC
MNLEMEGTMTNSERRVGLLRPCVPAPGEARPDWEIGCRFAALMGWEEQFSFASAADVFEEHKLCCSDVYALNMDGITYGRLKHHPIQWPCPTKASGGIPRRYRRKNFATDSGRARFHPVDQQPPAEQVSDDYPMALTTGRLAHQWHTRTKTRHVKQLNKLNPGAYVSANPLDANRLGLRDGDSVRLVSRRGVTRTRVKVDDSVGEGTLFMPIHWGQSAAKDGCVNAVMHSEADPISRQPELKHSAVRIEREGAPAS